MLLRIWNFNVHLCYTSSEQTTSTYTKDEQKDSTLEAAATTKELWDNDDVQTDVIFLSFEMWKWKIA